MTQVPVQNRVDRDDTVRIYSIMAVVIMADDMLHIHRTRDAIILVKFAGIGPKIGVIYDAFLIAFKMQVIDGIKTRQGWKKPPIGLSKLMAHQVAVAC